MVENPEVKKRTDFSTSVPQTINNILEVIKSQEKMRKTQSQINSENNITDNGSGPDIPDGLYKDLF